MFKIRQRNFLLISLVVVLTPCIVILIRMGPELSTEQTLSQRLAECHVRLQYLESVYRTRQEDVIILTQYLAMQMQQQHAITLSLLTQQHQQQQQQHLNDSIHNEVISTVIVPTSATPDRPDGTNNLLNALSPETRKLFVNATTPQLLSGVHNSFISTNNAVRLPSSYHFLPHLLENTESLRPSYLQTKSRTDVSIVLGIPTVKREKQTYVLRTLQNLIDNMDDDEQNDTLIVVYIGETNMDNVLTIAKEIIYSFETYIDNGLIDIVAPDASYYPDFNRIRITLNDSLDRVKWRSKQNLDFAYLMAYAHSKGTFYVQLEDDIMAKRHFITTMKKFAITKSALIKPDQTPWFVLDFCQLGFIGKLFRSVELPYLITFFQMFYNDMPVDWLLIHFMDTKVCRIDQDLKHCALEKSKYWLHHKPSLFQHIGTSSSLKGKVQKLKDKQFGIQVPEFYAHANNPPAIIKSNITPYKNFQIRRAYNGESYFWGLLPQPGDFVRFIFEKPTRLRHYLFRSGNTEHPSDRFYNTTVEILPTDSLKILNLTTSTSSIYNATLDGYLIVGAFDALGVAEGMIDARINAVRELRLHVNGESDNWVLLSEVQLLTDDSQMFRTESDKLFQHIGRIPSSGS